MRPEPPIPEPEELAAYLRRRALRYLSRHAAPRARVARLLRDHAARTVAAHDLDETLVNQMVADLLDDFERMALLDDAAFAAGRARREVQRGRSLERIRHDLQQRGVDRATADAAISSIRDEFDDGSASDGEPTAEVIAAHRYAERRRLGPWRPAEDRAAYRERDLAALTRQGFRFGLARRVIDAPDQPNS